MDVEVVSIPNSVDEEGRLFIKVDRPEEDDLRKTPFSVMYSEEVGESRKSPAGGVCRICFEFMADETNYCHCRGSTGRVHK